GRLRRGLVGRRLRSRFGGRFLRRGFVRGRLGGGLVRGRFGRRVLGRRFGVVVVPTARRGDERHADQHGGRGPPTASVRSGPRSSRPFVSCTLPGRPTPQRGRTGGRC